MKIWSQGAVHLMGQLPRIRDGFISLGHELTDYVDEADLLYSNNSPYDQLIKDKFGNHLKGKLILTVLDLPTHILDYDYEKVGSHLARADAVCTISKFVQKQVKDRFNIDSTVIYQPLKEISRTRDKKYPYTFLFCGRVNDRMKRADLGIQAVVSLGFREKDVVTVGSDIPFFGGSYLGVVTDEVLNDVYNSVDFVMCQSSFEGMGLPGCESVAAGAIPVVANDHPTFFEFFPLDKFPEYTNVAPHPSSLAAFIAGFLADAEKMEEFKERLHAHYESYWVGKLSGIGVAQSIVNVHNTLT